MYRLRMNRCVQAYRQSRSSRRFRASCDERYQTTVPCRGSFAQGGVTMRDCSKSRAGFDRVLMAVAATFLTVSATSALAAQRYAAHQRRRTRDRCGDPAPRTGQRPAAHRQRLQDRHHRLGARRAKAAEPNDRCQGGRTPSTERRCEARRHRRPRPPPATPRAAQRPLQRRPPSRSRPRAMSRRPISRSPTNCATCWAESRCAISTARPSAPPSRNSTRRANTRRCGPRPAADRQRQGRDRAAEGRRRRRPQCRRLSGAGFRRCAPRRMRSPTPR